MRCSRRAFNAGLAGWVAASTSAVGRESYLSFNPFVFSVASGDPTPDAVVIWTRLARAVDDPSPIANGPLEVKWFMALDPKLARVVRQGTAVARAEFGYSIHVDVQGLQSDRPYFFGFRMGRHHSPIGRTQTLPDAHAPLRSFRFNVVSCQHWEEGYFDAYQGMREDDAAFVLHLGDYIYDVNRGGVRQHESERSPVTLEDYRRRHALYKTDRALRTAHETLPFIAVPDNHDAVEFDAEDSQELVRRAAAYQAWCEFIPLRAVVNALSPSLSIFREVRVGSLLRLLILDTRQFRSSHDVCPEESDPKFAFGTYRRPCTLVDDPRRTMLGWSQEAWLHSQLKASAETWNVIGSTVMMTPFDLRHGEHLYRYLAGWDGYPANRERIMDWMDNYKVANPICLSGDIHSSLVSSIARRSGAPSSGPVMTEFVGTSISSLWPAELAAPMENALPANPHITFYDSAKRGYMRCTLTPKSWTTDIRTVEFTDRPGGRTRTGRSFAVEEGRRGAHQS
jgi:alkaline phosphatase D